MGVIVLGGTAGRASDVGCAVLAMSLSDCMTGVDDAVTAAVGMYGSDECMKVAGSTDRGSVKPAPAWLDSGSGVHMVIIGVAIVEPFSRGSSACQRGEPAGNEPRRMAGTPPGVVSRAAEERDLRADGILPDRTQGTWARALAILVRDPGGIRTGSMYIHHRRGPPCRTRLAEV